MESASCHANLLLRKTAADCAAKRNRDPTWDDRNRSRKSSSRANPSAAVGVNFKRFCADLARKYPPEWWSSPSLPPGFSQDTLAHGPLSAPADPTKKTRSNGRNDDKLHTLGNPLPVLGCVNLALGFSR